MKTGIVYKSTGSWYTVKTEDSHFYSCRIKGKFRMQGIRSTNPVAVGDIVDFDPEEAGDQTVGIITHIHDRKNYLVRKSVKLSKQLHVIASNIDQVFLLVTLKNPVTLPAFIDRFLVTAEAYEIPIVLIFNKEDSYSDEELHEVSFMAHMYQEIGYPCLITSVVTGKNVLQIKKLMTSKVSMFAGHSGVGKSTLINKLDPSLNLKTAELSEAHLQGQHTTTHAEMFDLSFGARIIDTPGIRGFGIVDMEKEEIGDYFPEFFRLKSECRFYNCLHIEEPSCAIKKALDEDRLFWSRYKSYLQLLEGDEHPYRTEHYD